MLCIGSRTVAHIQTDRTAVIGEFYGVVQDVDQNLPDADRLRHDIGIFHRFTVYLKVQAPVQKGTVYDLNCTIRNDGDIRRNRGEYHLSAFDTAQIQYIIQQGQQMIRAVLDFFQAVVDFGYRILMQRDIRKADDGIHRGTDIVGHIGKKDTFCFAGGLRLLCKGGHFFCFLLGGKL